MHRTRDDRAKSNYSTTDLSHRRRPRCRPSPSFCPRVLPFRASNTQCTQITWFWGLNRDWFLEQETIIDQNNGSSQPLTSLVVRTSGSLSWIGTSPRAPWIYNSRRSTAGGRRCDSSTQWCVMTIWLTYEHWGKRHLTGDHRRRGGHGWCSWDQRYIKRNLSCCAPEIDFIKHNFFSPSFDKSFVWNIQGFTRPICGLSVQLHWLNAS